MIDCLAWARVGEGRAAEEVREGGEEGKRSGGEGRGEEARGRQGKGGEGRGEGG